LTIALVLVGIALRECGHRSVEFVSRAEIASDRDRVVRAGMGTSERPAAQLAIAAKRNWIHHVDRRGAIFIPELADVEIAVDTVDPHGRTDPAPSMVSLTACIKALPSTTRCP
jgi:hypothetical protein